MDISIVNKSEKKGENGFPKPNSKNQLNSSRDKNVSTKVIQVERLNPPTFNWNGTGSPRMNSNTSQAGSMTEGRKNSLLGA